MTGITGVTIESGPAGPQERAPSGLPIPDLQVFFGSMRDSEKRPRDRKAGRRGGVTAIRKGVWLIRWSHGRDPDSGKRIRGKKTVRGTKAQAERVLTDELRRVDVGTAVRPNRITLGQWLNEWLRTWCQQVTDRTRHSYRGVIKAYVPDGLSRKQLRAVSARDLQELFIAMTNRPLSPRTVRMTRAVLRAALGRAVKLGHLDRNVATLVDLPALIKKERQVFTPQEARQFIKAAQADRWHALWVLLVTTGLRPGEALGLQWRDLDGDKLRVRRALVRIPGQPWRLEETKTGRSRVVSLPRMTVRVLTAHRVTQASERLRLSGEYEDRGFMFATSSGAPPDATNLVKKHFKPLLKRAGLPSLRLYDLRHTAATLMLTNGEHPKVVSEMLGHASITLTMDTYSHVTPDMQRESANRLDELLSSG